MTVSKLTQVSEPFLDVDVSQNRRRSYVYCDCECGTKNYKVSFTSFKREQVKSCGCLRRDAKYWQERNGKYFDRNMMIDLNNKGLTYPEIAKKLGCKTVTVQRAMSNLKIKSTYTGMFKNKNPAWTGCEYIPGSYFGRIKRCSIQRNIEFNVTIEYLNNIFKEQNFTCKLTGSPIVFGIKYQEITASLDRIDSSQGYIEGNVQWVHKDINIMKQSYTQDQFINWCKLVAANN